MSNRDDFLKGVRDALRDRVGGFCSRPECGRVTVAPGETNTAAVDITGRAAHITAAQVGGPRYDAALNSSERASVDNGIWLCADCADLIDKRSGNDFSAELIRGWKRAAEQRQKLKAKLADLSRRPTWLDKLRSPHYVNVPRLLHMVGVSALSPVVQAALENGFPQGISIIREMLEVQNALRLLSIRAVDVDDLTDPANQIQEGLMVSYNKNIRTRNGSNKNIENVRNYSFEKSPLIYLDSHRYRYIQPYDPIWLTTNTAHCTVTSGSTFLAGIAMVKYVDHSKKQVIASPLTFGVPNLFDL